MKHNPSILVVDDEQAHNILVSDALRQAGYTVTMVTDGFRALAACKVRVPDLMLLDLHMPLLGGMEVFQRLRSEERTKGIPIIFLSRKDEPHARAEKSNLASEEFLYKPFEMSELVVRVKNILSLKALRDELSKREGQIKELALTDPVTSLRSTRYLQELLRSEIAQSKRYQVPLSVVVMQMDQPKELSRAYGAKGVDSLSTQVAAIMTRQNRDTDILCRVGSLEFVILLPHTGREGAIEVAERLRTMIAQSVFTMSDSTIAVTASLGICQFEPGWDIEGKILLSHARMALAQAQQSGGNMTLMAH